MNVGGWQLVLVLAVVGRRVPLVGLIYLWRRTWLVWGWEDLKDLLVRLMTRQERASLAEEAAVLLK